MPDTVETQPAQTKQVYTEAQRASSRNYYDRNREQRRKARIERYRYYQDLGLCPSCGGARELAPNRKACLPCSQKGRK